jgi:hypothetical protein
MIVLLELGDSLTVHPTNVNKTAAQEEKSYKNMKVGARKR